MLALKTPTTTSYFHSSNCLAQDDAALGKVLPKLSQNLLCFEFTTHNYQNDLLIS